MMQKSTPIISQAYRELQDLESLIADLKNLADTTCFCAEEFDFDHGAQTVRITVQAANRISFMAAQTYDRAIDLDRKYYAALEAAKPEYLK